MNKHYIEYIFSQLLNTESEIRKVKCLTHSFDYKVPTSIQFFIIYISFFIIIPYVNIITCYMYNYLLYKLLWEFLENSFIFYSFKESRTQKYSNNFKTKHTSEYSKNKQKKNKY